jgi:iron complex transport system substrate-binding protein
MKKTTAWLHHHYSENLCLEDVAGHFYMSASQFRRKFKNYTGRSPVVYLKMLRIAEAKRLLLAGVPIKQVATQVGYADVFYFMRIFKKTTGMTAARFQAGKE